MRTRRKEVRRIVPYCTCDLQQALTRWSCCIYEPVIGENQKKRGFCHPLVFHSRLVASGSAHTRSAILPFSAGQCRRPLSGLIAYLDPKNRGTRNEALIWIAHELAVFDATAEKTIAKVERPLSDIGDAG